MKNDNIHSFFSLFWLQILNLPAALQNKNTRVGSFPWKRSVLQNPDRERTNQSTGICLRLGLPYNKYAYKLSQKLIGFGTPTIFLNHPRSPYKKLKSLPFLFVFALQELILDTLHYCMTIETLSALESGAMEGFTKLLSHKAASIRSKAARDVMDLR